jgi:S-adenosylmethionine synthetase
MGHPDKVADQISDAILDAMLAEDPKSRVAVETMVSTGMAVVAGEVRTEAYVEIPDIVRKTIQRIGYISGDMAFDYESCAVLTSIKKQSADIAMGVDSGTKGEEGAGDQGMMFGFACRETESLEKGSYMPLPIYLAHRLVERQAIVREKGLIPGLRPDAKSQVTVEYDGDRPVRVDTVVLSTQHGPQWNTKQGELKQLVIDEVLKPVLGSWWSNDVKVHVNPTGKFEIGGPHGDTGLTGRKIIVDTYGGRGRHGGGAFSGKDPTKVDRSAAYMARYIAKTVVAAGVADECEIQLSYAIGVPNPTSVHVSCFGTEKVDPDKISKAIRETFRLTPRGIIDALRLEQPIYSPTAYHGHFGRAPIAVNYQKQSGDFVKAQCFTWEALDKVGALQNLLSHTSARA